MKTFLWILLAVVITNPSLAGNQSFFEAGGPQAEDGKFLNPTGIAVDQQGNIYVADTGNNRLQKFNKQGRFLFKIISDKNSGEIVAPKGVAIDKGGFIYLACTDQLIKFDQTGQYITSGGHFEEDGDHLANPYQIAIRPDRQLLIADRSAGHLKIFAKDLSFVGYFIIPIVSQQGIIMPRGVAIDHQGANYVTTENNQIFKLDPSGKKILMRFGSYGSKEGELDRPHDIVVNQQGEIYVADSGNHRIQVFDRQGKFLTQFGKVAYQGGLGLDSQGNIYLVDSGNNCVLKFNPRGKLLMKFGAKGTAGYI